MNNITPERNDVNITKLFDWSSHFVVEGLRGEDLGTVYIRIVGDADLNRGRVVALRRAAELRKKLKDLDSDDRIAFIPEQAELEDERLDSFLILLRTRKLYNDAVKEVSLAFPKELDSEATLEKQEKYQEEVDTYQARLQKAIEDFVQVRVEKETKKIKELSKEEKYKQFVETSINELCEQQMMISFRDYCAFAGSYSEPTFKLRYFETIEEFEDLPSKIKNQFLAEYAALELDSFDLKK